MQSTRYPILFLSFLFTCIAINAQSLEPEEKTPAPTQDKGWFDNMSESLRGGYFLSERLLVGGSLGSEPLDFLNVGTFARYYLADQRQNWRPYLEIGGNVNISDGPIDNAWGFYGGVGVEKQIKDQTLLNIELLYTHYPGDRDFSGLNLNGNLNTTFGRKGSRNGIDNYFKRGTFILGSQLFNLGLDNSRFADAFQFDLTPKLGFMLTNRVMAKAGLNLGFSSFEFDPELTNIENYDAFTTELQLGLRYYLNPGRKASFFTEANLNYAYNRFSRDVFTILSLDRYSEASVDLQFGTSIFINSSVSIDLGLGAEYFFNDRLSSRDYFSGKASFGVNYWFD